MKIKGYRQVNGKWTRFEEKVGLGEFLRHLYYSYWTIVNYYWTRLLK